MYTYEAVRKRALEIQGFALCFGVMGFGWWPACLGSEASNNAMQATRAADGT
jgi:hypothetical protein